MKKVIIIGAGPAGITAANELLKDTKGEYDVTILEETERIGGISQTVRYNGNRMDIGGHRFFSKSDRRQLKDHAGLRFHLHGRKSHAGIFSSRNLFAYSKAVLINLFTCLCYKLVVKFSV